MKFGIFLFVGGLVFLGLSLLEDYDAKHTTSEQRKGANLHIGFLWAGLIGIVVGGLIFFNSLGP